MNKKKQIKQQALHFNLKLENIKMKDTNKGIGLKFICYK